MKLEDVIVKIEEIGSRRKMKQSDIQSLIEAMKHLEKKSSKSKKVVDFHEESV